MKSNHITPPANCTGCGLCANVCSKDKSIVELFLKQHGFPEPSKYQIKEKYQETKLGKKSLLT